MNDPNRRNRPHRTGIMAPLGELESAVMRHVWACEDAGCLGQEVMQALEKNRRIAITTVLTTLDRLANKGILRREREGRAYRYRATLTEQQIQQRIVDGVLGSLIAQFPKAVAAYFAQTGESQTERGGSDSDTLANLARRLEDMAKAPLTHSGREADEDA